MPGHPAPGERAADGADNTPDFEGVLQEAVALLEGQKDLPGIEPDTARERLLAGYRHILVDEYQDIDATQYRLVSAIAGRTLERNGDDGRLTLLAVGDDDQNIYAFRGASVEYIRRFRQDYDAGLHYLVENYRSSAHIIQAANALIGHNRERMKLDQPIRIDRGRAREPAGGRWAGLDRHSRGRVLVQQVPDPGRQAAAIVARIQVLQRLGGGTWRDFAVLARRHDVLAPVRALCEHAGIPVRLGTDLPGLHRVREVHAFLTALKEHGQAPLTPAQLDALLPPRPGTWRDLLAELIADWRAELGGAGAATAADAEYSDAEAGGPEPPDDAPDVDGLAVPAADIADFCWESLAEQRRQHRIGDGVLLATLHAAKGLEFPHVLIADGGWSRSGDAAEDERRAFYVGMTRARETLTLLDIAGGGHPHLPLLAAAAGAGGDWLLTDAPAVDAPPAEVVARRYTQLTLADLDLSYAGRHSPDAAIHRHLAALQAGDSLDWRPPGPPVSRRQPDEPPKPQLPQWQAADQETARPGPARLILTTTAGQPIARLSRRAAADWLPRSERIEAIRILALIRRERGQSDPDFAQSLRCDAWEVPLVEIRWRCT